MQDGGVVTVAMGSRNVCKTSIGNGRSFSFAVIIACNPSYLRLVSSISFSDSLLLESHGCDVIKWVSHNMNKLHLGA